MDIENFVSALKTECRDSAVTGCVSLFDDPPGRRPSEHLKNMSQWFKTLPAQDRSFVISAMREAADATLFGVLCVIDGVRVIERTEEKSEFHLTAIKNGIESLLSPNDTFLHDVLRATP
jgi:hypothetical protein